MVTWPAGRRTVNTVCRRPATLPHGATSHHGGRPEALQGDGGQGWDRLVQRMAPGWFLTGCQQPWVAASLPKPARSCFLTDVYEARSHSIVTSARH